MLGFRNSWSSWYSSLLVVATKPVSIPLVLCPTSHWYIFLTPQMDNKGRLIHCLIVYWFQVFLIFANVILSVYSLLYHCFWEFVRCSVRKTGPLCLGSCLCMTSFLIFTKKGQYRLTHYDNLQFIEWGFCNRCHCLFMYNYASYLLIEDYRPVKLVMLWLI